MKKLILATAISLLLAPTGFAIAADKAGAGLPAYGKDNPIPVPKISKKILANGMEIWVVPRKGVPRVDFVLAVRGAGYGADDPQLAGFANLLAGLLNEGTVQRDSLAIAEAAQGMGGVVAAAPGNDGITVAANALASNAAAMMTLLAEVTRQPSFPEQEVRLAKANAMQALRAAEANPGYRADRAMSQAIFGDHPYGRTEPTAEAISAASAELLRAEHARRFRPDRSLLIITGNISKTRGMKMAKAAFADWQVSGTALPDTAAAPLTARPVRLLLERPGSVQSTLRIGRPGGAASAADYVPLRLTSAIVGGGFSSRINMNLREEKGYTYGASASARTYRYGGSIFGGADVRNAVTGASLQEYFSEYRKLGSELVPQDEMEMNKRYVAGSYMISNQRQRSMADTLARNWLNGLPPEFFGQFVPLIRKTSAEQVREMGKKYFAPETQAIVVVGDKAAVSEQLKEFGEFTVLAK